jgi:hypothetical protein
MSRRHPADRADRGVLRSPRAQQDPLTLLDYLFDDQLDQLRKHHAHKLCGAAKLRRFNGPQVCEV